MASCQFTSLDLAFKKALHNLISVNIEGKIYPVPAYISSPEEQYAKNPYPVPSYGIYAFDLMHVPEREYDKVWTYSDRDSVTMNRRPAPVKVNLSYQITTQSFFTQHDRLLMKTLLTVFPPKSHITVAEESGVTTPVQYTLHCFYQSMQTLDAQDNQYRIYKKAFTYQILGWLDENLKTSQKLVTEVQGAFGTSKSTLTQQLEFTELY